MTKQDNQNNQAPSRRDNKKVNSFNLKALRSSKWLPKEKKTYWILGAAAVVVVICAIAFKVYADISGFGSDIYEDVNSAQLRDADAQLKNGEPITILLTGLDSGALYYEDVEETRTDVMMVFTINPKTNESTVVSIPRDALGVQSDTDEFDKLNHAYMNYNGIEGTINSLQRYLDMPIDYYVNVNMQGFMDVIDALGGVDITPTLTFTQNDVSFTEGETRTLSGIEAMQYVRMRKSDPEGDIGREKRQQQLIEAVVDKVISLGTITNYNDILDAVGDDIKTNITVDNMFALQSNYLAAMDNLNKLVFDDYVDLNLDFGYYMLIPELERLENVSIMQDNIDYEATNSAIVYPVEYGVESTYFPVSDLNWDGVLTDDEMAIQPGVYSREDLNELVKYIFGYSINDYLESTGNTALIDENEDQTIPTTLDDELLEHITAGFDPSGTVTEYTNSDLDTYGDTTTGEDTGTYYDSSTYSETYYDSSTYSETSNYTDSYSNTYSDEAPATSESMTVPEESVPETSQEAPDTSEAPVTFEEPVTDMPVEDSTVTE
ncbi:LCP family protein [Aerococcus urinaeequi]|uniref:LCP family glycopolymer transferase n=1 Tax=Aerococcus urinaeequi TaxID=51665 RepID=UPI003B3A744A